MDFQQTALATCGAIVAFVWYKLYRNFTISDVRGPKNPSWVYGISVSPTSSTPHHLTGPGTGHRWWWIREEARVVEKSLIEEYGTVVRWNGLVGVGCSC